MRKHKLQVNKANSKDEEAAAHKKMRNEGAASRKRIPAKFQVDQEKAKTTEEEEANMHYYNYN